MLSPAEFSVGVLGDAPHGSLLLPRSTYEQPFLVGTQEGKLVAVFLSGEHRFYGFEPGENDRWKGLIIPNIRFEVDEQSAFDPLERRLVGSLVRGGATMGVMARIDPHYSAYRHVVLVDALPPTGERDKAGFSRWAITLGEGRTKRTLMTIDAQAPSSPAEN